MFRGANHKRRQGNPRISKKGKPLYPELIAELDAMKASRPTGGDARAKCLESLERVKGIEPSYSAWKAAAYP
jgi:hypothetical protein